MEQQGERLDPQSGGEPWIQANGAVGNPGDAVDPGEGAWEAGEDADAGEDPGAVWETQEDAEAVAWDVGDDAGGALDPDGPGGRPATGEPRVDATLARLDELAARPVTEHRAIFEDVHRRLRDVLGELDTREPDQAPAAGAERRAGR
ncbi:MAG: hypothetical protein ACRDOA_20910 [Streptosporangiaceae bacterium]